MQKIFLNTVLVLTISMQAYDHQDVHDLIDYSTIFSSLIIVAGTVGLLGEVRKYYKNQNELIRDFHAESVSYPPQGIDFGPKSDPEDVNNEVVEDLDFGQDTDIIDEGIVNSGQPDECSPKKSKSTFKRGWFRKTFSRGDELFRALLVEDFDNTISDEDIHEADQLHHNQIQIAKRLNYWRYIRNTGIGLLTLSGVGLALYKHVFQYTDRHNHSLLHQIADYTAISAAGISLMGSLLILKDYCVGLHISRNNQQGSDVQLGNLLHKHENNKKVCLAGAGIGVISGGLLLADLVWESLTIKNLKRAFKKGLFRKKSFSKYRS